MKISINQRFGFTAERRRKLLYVPILVAAMALMMIRLLVMARLLSIEEFGFFSIGILVSSTLSMLGCFGLQIMLQRDAPGYFLRGQDRNVAVLTIQCFIVAVVIFVIGLAVVCISAELLAINVKSYGLGVFHGLSQQLFLIATLESRSRGDVLRFAAQNVVRSAIIFCMSFVIAYGSESSATLLLVEASITIFLSIYFIKAGLPDQTEVSELIRSAYVNLPNIKWTVALVLLGSSMYSILLANGDRWIASAVLDLSEFAQYSFVWIILAIAQSAQAVMNASIFPFLSRLYALKGSQAAFSACLRIAAGSGVLLAVFSLPTYFLMCFFIRQWYPNYNGVIPLLPVFLAIAILRMSDFWTTFMLVRGLERMLVYYNSMSLMLFMLVVGFAYAAGFLTGIDSQKVAYLALAINLIFVGTTAVVSFRNRDAVH